MYIIVLIYLNFYVFLDDIFNENTENVEETTANTIINDFPGLEADNVMTDKAMVEVNDDSLIEEPFRVMDVDVEMLDNTQKVNLSYYLK